MLAFQSLAAAEAAMMIAIHYAAAIKFVYQFAALVAKSQ